MLFRITLALLFTCPAWSADLAMPDGLNYTATHHPHGYEVQVPLPSAGKAAIELHPFNPDLESAVSNSLRQSKAGEPFAIVIRFQDSNVSPIKPGAYRFRLTITPEPPKGTAAKPESFPLSIQIPPAVITPPPALELQLTAGCFAWTCDEPIPVTYRTTDLKGRLTGVQVTQHLPYTQDGKPVSGQLKVEMKKGAPAEVRFNLSNGSGSESLAQGTFHGQLLLTADQLAQPLTVAVKIVRRASLVYLAFFIFAGFYVGYRFRTKNEERIAFLAVEIDSHRLLQQIAALLSTNADPAMTAELKAVEREVKEKLSARSIKAEELTQYRERLTAAAKALAAAGKQLTDDAAALLALLGYRRLPAPLEAVVEAARESIKAAVILDRNNVAEGRQRFSQAGDAWRGGVLREGRVWTQEYSLNLELWEALQPFIAGKESKDLPPGLSALIEKFQTVRSLLANSALTDQQAATALESIHQLTADWPPIHRHFPSLWQRFVDDLSAELLVKKLDPGPPLKAQLVKVAQLIGLESASQQATQELRHALTALRGYLRPQVAAIPDETARAAALKAFDEGKWIEVIRALEPGSAPDAEPVRISVPEPGVGEAALLVDSTPETPVIPWEPPLPPDVTIANLQSELEQREGWRRVVAAGLLSAAGFFALQTNYSGSGFDLLVAFSWAYSTDLLAANAMALVSKGFPKAGPS
jgi:hypothetical protein